MINDKYRQTDLLDSVIPDKMFYKIREVAKIADVKPHVLRYWESEFPSLKPQKNKNGQRVYSRKDIDLILEIRKLLHIEKYSIAGARQALKKKRKPNDVTPSPPLSVEPVAITPPPVPEPESETETEALATAQSDALDAIREIRAGLLELVEALDESS